MAHALKRAPVPNNRVTSRFWVRPAVVRVCLAIVLATFAGWHYWTMFSSLSTARTEMTAIQGEFDPGSLDVNTSAERMQSVHARSVRAADAITRARLHYKWDPLVQLARYLPVAGPQVDATGRLIEMAGLSVRIADTAAGTGEALATIRDQHSTEDSPTAALDRAIEQTRGNVDEVQRLTEELLAKRIALGDRELLTPLASAREQIDAQLPGLAIATRQLKQAYETVPAFLGFEGERKYLVLALNNGELLPGGGLVSAAGILRVADGVPQEVDFIDSTTWKWDWEAQGGAYIEPPGPLKRYLLRDYTWNLLVSNWSPDFPTWSRQALEFYELVHGHQDVDGVVAMDLEVLRSLLAVTGPRVLEVEGHGPVTFTSENAVLELERVTRHSFDPAEPDRKSVIGSVADVLLTDIQRVPVEEWGALVDVVRALGAGRHIQIFSFDRDEQAFLAESGWAGQLDMTSPDYVQFNEASVNSTKLNLIVQPEGTYSVDISALGTAYHQVLLHYENPLPAWSADKDPKLVKQLMLGGLYGGYLRVFGPGSMTDWSASADGSPVSIEDTSKEGSRRWFGAFIPLAAGAVTDRSLGWTVPLATTSPGAREYELLIQKQAGTRALCLQLDVTREGEQPDQLELRGGHIDAQGRLCLSTDVTVKAVWR